MIRYMGTKIYDLAIIGGGIAGLSAAINASAEGISTIILEGSNVFGGQAGQASLIENYLGFPNGISGEKLINDSIAQANKFGTQPMIRFNVDSIRKHNNVLAIYSEFSCILAKSVVIASGMAWKKIDAKNIDKFIGKGIKYGSPDINQDHTNKRIVIAGGANSAGQAAMFLSNCEGCKVDLIIRNESKTGTMSDYLAKRVLDNTNITIHTESDIIEVSGHDKLESVKINSGNVIKADELYILIGGEPKTDWIDDTLISLDSNYFIRTGQDYMTSLAGVFAVGDVRSGSIKRVANAAGEGAACVNSVRSYLKFMEN